MAKMELLAPAGGMTQLRAALRFGADAVYGGMRQYGLRAFAGETVERNKWMTAIHLPLWKAYDEERGL